MTNISDAYDDPLNSHTLTFTVGRLLYFTVTIDQGPQIEAAYMVTYVIDPMNL